QDVAVPAACGVDCSSLGLAVLAYRQCSQMGPAGSCSWRHCISGLDAGNATMAICGSERPALSDRRPDVATADRPTTRRGGDLKILRFLLAPIILACFGVPHSYAQFPSAPGTGPGLPETIEAIDSARVTTRILYITAHPDDESAAVLTYLARGLHADVALLSITRGEGGQNALGPEQAPQLGLIRTQELLAATRGYGVKLYFTRARDFGYSKTPEETERIWGDQVLEDMVRVIRSFRPNIVINHWGGVHSGHGHHQLSGLWTPKAVALAADASYKLGVPSAPGFLGPDEAPWNPAGGVQVLDLERSDAPKGYVLPLDDVSPLYGKSYREIGL